MQVVHLALGLALYFEYLQELNPSSRQPMHYIPSLLIIVTVLATLGTPALAGPGQKRICIKNTVTTPTRVVETLSDFYVVDVNGSFASLAGMMCSTLPVIPILRRVFQQTVL